MTSPRLCLEEMLSGQKNCPPLIDIGTTSLTGVRQGALPGRPENGALAHPIFRTIPMSPADCARMGSDFMRTGLLFPSLPPEEEYFTDLFGVEWLTGENYPAPAGHPLENAGPADIARYPIPLWTQPAQQVETDLCSNSIVIADAPCPGLLELCFMLRNTWQFMDDVAEKRPAASALLDWSLKAVLSAYEYMLVSLAGQPDVIIYNDDFGYQDGMFLSPREFRIYVRPRLRILLERLRSLTPAAICLHSCGSISPILPDIADLGFELLNLDTCSRGMEVVRLRRELPDSVILHGATDLCALGEAVMNRDKAGVAYLVTELAQSAPAIAGPADSLSSAEEVRAAVRGAAFIRNLSGESFAALRRFGPVRGIIEEAMENTLTGESPDHDAQRVVAGGSGAEALHGHRGEAKYDSIKSFILTG